MMKEIANNAYYTILVDTIKNRVYLTVKGFWKSATVVPNYVVDIRQATHDVSSGYTLLADVSQMKTPPPEVANLHMEAQKICVDEGLKKTAELVEKSFALKMPLDRYSKASKMTKRIFTSKEEAETWLDEE
jgi:hypothetical protein